MNKEIKPIQDAEEFLLAAANELMFQSVNDELIEDVVIERGVPKDIALDLIAQDLKESIQLARLRLTQAENSLEKLNQ